MYYHQVMEAPDAANFNEAIIKAVNGHINNKNWRLIPIIQVPKTKTLFLQYVQWIVKEAYALIRYTNTNQGWMQMVEKQ